MGNIPDSSYTWPVPLENVTGIGVAGPPANEVEKPEQKEQVENTSQTEKVVQTENSEFSEEEVGNNIDVEA